MTGYRVGYTVATQLVDELVEATDEMFLTTTMGRYGRIVLLVIVEPGYVALDCRGAQPCSQVLTDRAAKNSVAIASHESLHSGMTAFTDPAN